MVLISTQNEDAAPPAVDWEGAKAIAQLRQACEKGLPGNSSLSDDGKTLTLFDSTHDARNYCKITLCKGTKEVWYTLGSVYLLLMNPSALVYPNACNEMDILDPVDASDRKHVRDHFLFFGNVDGK